MRKYIAVCILISLTACANWDIDKGAIVADSGPYSYKHELKYGFISRALSGEDSAHGIMYWTTKANFEKTDGSNEKIKFEHLVSRYMVISDVHAKTVTPGIYRLTSFGFGSTIAEYNRQKCGDITFEVKPHEIVYIGGIEPIGDVFQDNEVMPLHTQPQFIKKLDLKMDDVIPSMPRKEDKNIYAKWPIVTRLPKNNISPPAECFKKAVHS